MVSWDEGGKGGRLLFAASIPSKILVKSCKEQEKAELPDGTPHAFRCA